MEVLNLIWSVLGTIWSWTFGVLFSIPFFGGFFESIFWIGLFGFAYWWPPTRVVLQWVWSAIQFLYQYEPIREKVRLLWRWVVQPIWVFIAPRIVRAMPQVRWWWQKDWQKPEIVVQKVEVKHEQSMFPCISCLFFWLRTLVQTGGNVAVATITVMMISGW